MSWTKPVLWALARALKRWHRLSGPHQHSRGSADQDAPHHACQVCMHADLEQTRMRMTRTRPGQARGAAPSRRWPRILAWASARSRARPTRCPAPGPPAPQSAGTASRPAPRTRALMQHGRVSGLGWGGPAVSRPAPDPRTHTCSSAQGWACLGRACCGMLTRPCVLATHIRLLPHKAACYSMQL
jgi:hypothetical protein